MDLGDRFVHLSDTELLNTEAVDLAVSLKPDIIITDEPPIYKYLHDESFTDGMLSKAAENLAKLSQAAETIIVDHHILRCDQGYEWLAGTARKLPDARITSAAEYIHGKPLLLEAWRSILYKYYPVPNNWFKQDYTGLLEKYRSIYHEIKDRAKNSATSKTVFENTIRNLADQEHRYEWHLQTTLTK